MRKAAGLRGVVVVKIVAGVADVRRGRRPGFVDAAVGDRSGSASASDRARHVSFQPEVIITSCARGGGDSIAGGKGIRLAVLDGGDTGCLIRRKNITRRADRTTVGIWCVSLAVRDGFRAISTSSVGHVHGRSAGLANAGRSRSVVSHASADCCDGGATAIVHTEVVGAGNANSSRGVVETVGDLLCGEDDASSGG